MNKIGAYLEDLTNSDLSLSEISNESLMEGVINGDKDAREKFILKNLKIVIHIAKKYHNQYIDLEDLVQIGNIALIKAVNNYKPVKDAKFTTYAVKSIVGAFLRVLYSERYKAHVPSYINSNVTKVFNSLYSIYAKIGRYPTAEEIAAETNISLKIVKECLELPKDSYNSLNEVVTEDGSELIELLHDDNKFEDDSVNKMLVSDALNHSGLTEIERNVIDSIYGFNGYPMNCQEVADNMDCSRQNVFNAKKRALIKIKNYLKAKGYE